VVSILILGFVEGLAAEIVVYLAEEQVIFLRSTRDRSCAIEMSGLIP
jgi:hypothetical protein